MVKLLLRSLFLLLFCLSLEGGHINTSDIEEGFRQFKMLTPEEQTKYLKDLFEEFDDETRKSHIQELLKLYESDQRQGILNALITDPSTNYGDLLVNLSTKECTKIGDRVNPTFFGTLPLIDWLNISNFPSFFQPTLKNALINRGHFNDYNSFDQVSVWAEPYGYHYDRSRGSLRHHLFDLYTIGLSVGGDYTMLERLIFSFGLAYSYTSVDWKKLTDTASIHTLYFGPSLSYLFPYGYLSTMILGAANFYHVERETELFDGLKKDAHGDFTSWDVACRLEGGLSLPLGKSFYLYPTVLIDYLAVFELAANETLDKNTHLIIQSLTESFFRTKVSLRVTREVFGFLTPHLSVGWQKFTPLTQNSYKYDIEGCDETFNKNTTIGSWSQYCLGTGLSFLHKRGVFGSLSYEFCGGYGRPMHVGDVRIGLTW